MARAGDLGDFGMKSPFPGMDPYLEAHWRDVHAGLTVYARDYLQSRLPKGLKARIEERVFVEFPGGEGRDVYPDVRVVERPQAAEDAGEGGLAVMVETIAEPVLIELQSEPISEGYITIVDAEAGNRIITTIEFLSPTNKRPGEGQLAYQQKQREMQLAGVSQVEVDLVRAGRRPALILPDRLPPKWRGTYQACVWRAWRPRWAEIYPMDMRTALPTIPVPLRPSDQVLPLNLQKLIDQCYANGGYDDIDYKLPPDPPLEQPDAAWVDELLRKAGRR
jgi:hypothetical protein